MPVSGVGGAEDGMACHVFSSSNHEFPLGKRWADLYDAIQSRATGYRLAACIHLCLLHCFRIRVSIAIWGPSISTHNIQDKFDS